MNGRQNRPPIKELGVDPHEWELAAEQIAASHLNSTLQQLIRDSNLPGTINVTAEAWPVEDRIQFLKTLCGEQQ